jgi:hypothetical protein
MFSSTEATLMWASRPLREALRIAERLTDPDSLRPAYLNLGNAVWLAGRVDEALQVELREHGPDLLASPLVGEAQEARAVVSTINRNSGTHQPESIRQASTGSAQTAQVASCQRLARNDASQCHT